MQWTAIKKILINVIYFFNAHFDKSELGQAMFSSVRKKKLWDFQLDQDRQVDTAAAAAWCQDQILQIRSLLEWPLGFLLSLSLSLFHSHTGAGVNLYTLAHIWGGFCPDTQSALWMLQPSHPRAVGSLTKKQNAGISSEFGRAAKSRVMLETDLTTRMTMQNGSKWSYSFNLLRLKIICSFGFFKGHSTDQLSWKLSSWGGTQVEADFFLSPWTQDMYSKFWQTDCNL